MKKFLVLVFTFIVIKSFGQTIISSEGWSRTILSKDTTVIDTAKCDFLIIDRRQDYNPNGYDVHFMKGKKVTIMKGLMTKAYESIECPEHRIGCLVLHMELKVHNPPVIEQYYLDPFNIRINKFQERYIIKELN